MHRGVQALLGWLAQRTGDPEVKLAGAVDVRELAEVEDSITSPLPTDLRILLGRFNGGSLPSGILLHAGGAGPDSIFGVRRALAGQLGRPVDDPDLPLPFFRSEDGAVLAFDRSAAPIADTWPVVDCPPEDTELRLVHRTFDGWCRLSLREWTAPERGQPFSLERYLAGGKRHVEVEPDVAAAHATVAHALRRSGQPAAALESYMVAARCVPPLPWCDWEALKLGVLLREAKLAMTAARRLCTRAPARGWRARGVTPRQVAEVLALLVTEIDPPDALVHLLDLLALQAPPDDAPAIATLRRTVHLGEALPPSRPIRPTAVAPSQDLDAFWTAVEAAYRDGLVRDDDLLLDPAYQPLFRRRTPLEILSIRRDF